MTNSCLHNGNSFLFRLVGLHCRQKSALQLFKERCSIAEGNIRVIARLLLSCGQAQEGNQINKLGEQGHPA
jgi:hypothetical protein